MSKLSLGVEEYERLQDLEPSVMLNKFIDNR